MGAGDVGALVLIHPIPWYRVKGTKPLLDVACATQPLSQECGSFDSAVTRARLAASGDAVSANELPPRAQAPPGLRDPRARRSASRPAESPGPYLARGRPRLPEYRRRCARQNGADAALRHPAGCGAVAVARSRGVSAVRRAAIRSAGSTPESVSKSVHAVLRAPIRSRKCFHRCVARAPPLHASGLIDTD